MFFAVLSGVACILAGLGRAAVGAGWSQRFYTYPLIALFAGLYGFGFHAWAVPFIVVPMLVIWLGWTKWEDPIWMTIRYGLAPGILAITYAFMTNDPTPIAWAMACGGYGAVDGLVRVKLEPYGFTLWGQQIDSARYAEFLTGAIIVGGVALLGIHF